MGFTLDPFFFILRYIRRMLALHLANASFVSGRRDFARLRRYEPRPMNSTNGKRPGTPDEYDNICELLNIYNGICRDRLHGREYKGLCMITGMECCENMHIIPHANRWTTAAEVYNIAQGWLSEDRLTHKREKMTYLNLIKADAKIGKGFEPNKIEASLAATINDLTECIYLAEDAMHAMEHAPDRRFYRYNMMRILHDWERTMPGREDIKLFEYDVYHFGEKITEVFMRRLNELNVNQMNIHAAEEPLEYPIEFNPPLASTFLSCHLYFTILMTYKCLRKHQSKGHLLSERSQNWLRYARYLFGILESETASSFRALRNRPEGLRPLPPMALRPNRTHRFLKDHDLLATGRYARRGNAFLPPMTRSHQRNRLAELLPLPMDATRRALQNVPRRSRAAMAPILHALSRRAHGEEARRDDCDLKEPNTPAKHSSEPRKTTSPQSDVSSSVSDRKETQFTNVLSSSANTLKMAEKKKVAGKQIGRAKLKNVVAQLHKKARVIDLDQDIDELGALDVEKLMRGAIEELQKYSEIASAMTREVVQIVLPNGNTDLVSVVTSRGLRRLRDWNDVDVDKRQNDLTKFLEDAKMRLQQIKEEKKWEKYALWERYGLERRHPFYSRRNSQARVGNAGLMIM